MVLTAYIYSTDVAGININKKKLQKLLKKEPKLKINTKFKHELK